MALEKARAILDFDLTLLQGDPKALAKMAAEQRATLTSILSAQVRVNTAALRGKSSDRIEDILDRLEADGWIDIYAIAEHDEAQALADEMFS